jgi:gluconate kinase
MSKVLLLTGTPGAGKSTVSKAFSSQASGEWAYIDQDEIRKQVKAGFADPSNPWTDRTQAQWDVSIDICADMTRRYKKVGINCLIDCFLPPHALEKWRKAFKDIDFKLVIFLPEIEVAVSRNDKRSGKARLREKQVRSHHSWFEDYKKDKHAILIDSSKLSVNELVKVLTLALK